MYSKPEISLLYDFYGELLQASQQRVVELYVNEDLSLAETAELLGISRQGVRDSLSRAKNKLSDDEEKLGLYRAYIKRRERDEKIRSVLSKIKDQTVQPEIPALLDEIDELLKGDD